MDDVGRAFDWAAEQFSLSQHRDGIALIGLNHVPAPLLNQDLQIVNPWRPDVDSLVSQGFMVQQDASHLQAGQFSLVLVRPEREGVARRARLAFALSLLAEGGELCVVAPVREGGKRLAEVLETLGVPEASVYAKAHCRVVWVKRPVNLDSDLLASAINDGAPQQLASGLWTQPGLFSWDHVDIGSALLVKVLPDRLGSHVIDAGAGWGWLSHAVASKAGRCDTLALLEADARALNLAVKNVGDQVVTRPFWVDATQAWPIDNADAIVCNPPFHDQGKATRRVGEAMLEHGLHALAPKGVMWAVANKHLPYEHCLGALGARVQVVVRDEGFKVLRVTKGARLASARQDHSRHE